MTELVTKEFIPEFRGRGVHDATVMVQHIGQPGGEADPWEAQDLANAKWIRTYLMTRFPVGYEWCCNSDLRHGIIKFSIPVLMGVTNWYVVNLKKSPDLATAVLHGAGEILERYRLSRSIFSQAAFLDAREKHSKLVDNRRGIPD